MTDLAKRRRLCVEFLILWVLVDMLPHAHMAASAFFGASFVNWLCWARLELRGEGR